MRLLYAEDEPALSEAVTDVLTYHHYTVDAVSDGEEALQFARLQQYDGMILDIMMPGLDGLSVLKQLRAEGCRTPILLLTAKTQVEDRILGLDLGADDYLPKPFAMGELLARVRAMLRRREEFTPDILEFADLKLDRQNYRLSVGEQGITLPKAEYQVMELFLLNRGLYLSTETILEKIWGYETEAEPGIVWVYISYLRKRLASLGSRVELKVKRNIGYKLEVRAE